MQNRVKHERSFITSGPVSNKFSTYHEAIRFISSRAFLLKYMTNNHKNHEQRALKYSLCGKNIIHHK